MLKLVAVLSSTLKFLQSINSIILMIQTKL